jgi:phosphoribosyl 1,2-cyclic phosphodiesterase
LRFASLGSGSRGNGTVIESGSTRILIDCGFSETDTRRRLARLALEPGDLDAILVTHEHSDHIRGVARFSGKHDLPVWLSHGTHQQANDDILKVNLIHGHEPFSIGDLQIFPVPVPHDAREPLQFVVSDGNWRLGLLTDTGSITAHIQEMLDKVDALLLECNHDVDMLMEGTYPPALKERVGGRLGHLSNDQAAELLNALDRSKLQHVIAMHLSEKNNTPELARTTLCDVLDCGIEEVPAACQDDGFDWRELL